jgi:hypothetical protein
MTTVDSLGNYRDLFNRSTLELTFRMLRHQQPALALQIQNALVAVYPRDDYHTALAASELPLSPETIKGIIAALSALSNQLLAAGTSQRNELTIVRSLMLDWLMLAHNCAQPAA